jgi:8-oxo-dGTP pyrophosphatase MutT (NUDIX family)
MKFNNTPNRCIKHEGETLWLSRSATVLGVLFFVQSGKAYVPVGQRGPGLPNEVGKWGLPGGYLDYGETIGEAMKREVWEELGLNLEALRETYTFRGSLEQPYFIDSTPRYQQNLTMRFPALFLLGDAPLPTLSPQVGPDEVTGAKWLPLEEALQSELAFRHHLVLADCLEKYFNGNLEK